MNGLDLFSGKGGFAKAVERLGIRPVAYCEKDQFARAVLLSRQISGDLPLGPIWDDVSTLQGAVHLLPFLQIGAITGGFPCQDISLAGARAGLGGKRSGLFFQIVRLTKELSPIVVCLENVWPGVRKFVPAIRAEFEALGFQCRDGHLAASDVGAPHKRDRWFFIATHTDRLKKWLKSQRELGSEGPTFARYHGEARSLADSAGIGERESPAQTVAVAASRQARDESVNGGSPLSDARGIGRNTLWTEPERRIEVCRRAGILPDGDGVERALFQRIVKGERHAGYDDWWASEPEVGRVVDGFADRLARALHVCELHTLGNGLVPRQGAEAFQRLAGIHGGAPDLT